MSRPAVDPIAAGGHPPEPLDETLDRLAAAADGWARTAPGDIGALRVITPSR